MLQACKFQKVNAKKAKIAEIAGPSCSRLERKQVKKGIKSAKDKENTQYFCLVCFEQYRFAVRRLDPVQPVHQMGP